MNTEDKNKSEIQSNLGAPMRIKFIGDDYMVIEYDMGAGTAPHRIKIEYEDIVVENEGDIGD